MSLFFLLTTSTLCFSLLEREKAYWGRLRGLMGDLCVAFFLFSVTFLIPMLVVFIMDLGIREYPEGVLLDIIVFFRFLLLELILILLFYLFSLV